MMIWGGLKSRKESYFKEELLNYIFMKTRNFKNMAIAMFVVCLFFYSESLFAQDERAQIFSKLEGYRGLLKDLVQTIIGICALGGGLYSYFKVQTDDGGSGKKAIGNFVFALLFGSLLIVIIELFFPGGKAGN